MDHVVGIGARGTHPGFLDRYYYGRRPTGFYMPRYLNTTERTDVDFVRGFGFQGYSERSTWRRGGEQRRHRRGAQAAHAHAGPLGNQLVGFGEMLPRAENRVTLDNRRSDKWGIPLVHIECAHGDNERRLAERASPDAVQMLKEAGFEDVAALGSPRAPGTAVHEMGTARMGHDPKTSVLNRHNQAHDVPNLFVTDGSCMSSSGSVNPSLTYMALSARAANFAADRLGSGDL